MSVRRLGAARDPILRPAQGRYLRSLLSPRDPLLAELERGGEGLASRRRDPATVRLLEVLAATREPARVLDLACGAGEGTLAVARGAPRATVVAVESCPDLAAIARATFERGLVAERVELVEEDPLARLARAGGPFDLVLLEAPAPRARQLVDHVLPQLAVRGMLIVDRCLAEGRLADPTAADLDDPARRRVELLNPYLMIHPQLRAVMLPIGEGVILASKSRPLVLELGGPF